MPSRCQQLADEVDAEAAGGPGHERGTQGTLLTAECAASMPLLPIASSLRPFTQEMPSSDVETLSGEVVAAAGRGGLGRGVWVALPANVVVTPTCAVSGAADGTVSRKPGQDLSRTVCP